MIFLITYDLKAPKKDYEGLYEDIKKCGSSWVRPVGSVWLIETDRTTEEVAEILTGHLDEDDRLFVAQCEGKWASFNLETADIEWLKENSVD